MNSRPISTEDESVVSTSQVKRKFKLRYLNVFWLLLGPGVLAMIGDNDAGGVISYAVTGAKFGVGLFIPLVLVLGVVTFTVQEMSLRVGVVSSTGYAKLVFDRFGKFWGYYHITTLTLENLITLLTEFIGMTAGLVILGLPLWTADLVSLGLVVSITMFTGYWTKERLTLFIGALNVVFVVVALLTHPSFQDVAHALVRWNLPAFAPFKNVIWYVIATIGNAIAPWMIFFQGSAVIDKGVTKKQLVLGRMDTAIGAVVQVVIAAFIILCGAALFGHVSHLSSAGPATLISALNIHFGRLAAILFGFGIFNAGFLAAITISLSSSWTIAESFGWARSLNDSIRKAPGFYGVYFGSLLVAAGVLLIPNLPMDFISVLAQVVGGVLIAPILIFLVLFAADRKMMGQYASRLWSKCWGWSIVILLIALTIATFWQTFGTF
ncbi:MAG: divalent metal cation transporter [Alicyclobacillaceae bacterium]|nr:divalent metal cation transporter [Alicyclobacillaceae bacterium]MCY0895394.1 divalent metal cation transporter [Alicyclobacillaceae bacterium]